MPFKAASLRRTKQSNILRFCGKSIRLFEHLPASWREGSFSQNDLGEWFLNIAVSAGTQPVPAPDEAVGVDLGLKDLAVTSDAGRLEADTFYRGLEAKIQQAQRRGHKRQAKRLHRRARHLRDNALHQFSRGLFDRYRMIFVGDVSSTKLAKTRMAKAVLDSGGRSSARSCSTRASGPADALQSSARNSQRGHVLAAVHVPAPAV